MKTDEEIETKVYKTSCTSINRKFRERSFAGLLREAFETFLIRISNLRMFHN